MSVTLPHPRVAGPVSNFADVEAALRAIQRNFEAGGPRTLGGEVAADGSVVRGEGFTASRVSVGNYDIKFDVPFRTPPNVVPGAGPTPSICVRMSTATPVSPTGCRVIVFSAVDGATLADGSFVFHVREDV